MDDKMRRINKGFCARIFGTCADRVNEIADLIAKKDYPRDDLAIVLADSSDRNGFEIAKSLLKDGFFRKHHNGDSSLVICFAIYKARLLKLIDEIDPEVSADIKAGEAFPVVVIGYGTVEKFSCVTAS